MAIFNSYVNLPEGKVNHPLLWPKLFLVGQLWWLKYPESLDVRSSLQDQFQGLELPMANDWIWMASSGVDDESDF
jgi:hypothetical protein